jgi:hypothetical protein
MADIPDPQLAHDAVNWGCGILAALIAAGGIVAWVLL